MNKTIITKGAEQTERLGESLGKKLAGTETLALFGGLGMGKTAFVRGLARGLGIAPEEVSSPTFAIVHEHLSLDCAMRLFHYDMYRVESWEDLDSTGFFESLAKGVNAVEWSENIENALPTPRYDIEFAVGKAPDERAITITLRE